MNNDFDFGAHFERLNATHARDQRRAGRVRTWLVIAGVGVGLVLGALAGVLV